MVDIWGFAGKIIIIITSVRLVFKALYTQNHIILLSSPLYKRYHDYIIVIARNIPKKENMHKHKIKVHNIISSVLYIYIIVYFRRYIISADGATKEQQIMNKPHTYDIFLTSPISIGILIFKNKTHLGLALNFTLYNIKKTPVIMQKSAPKHCY